MTQADPQHDAWNPGITSPIPARLRPLVTLYRPGNSTTTHAEARDAADFCGATPPEMVAFTFDRLVTHETLIRVTADLHVPDGQAYEDLGVNLRGMAAAIIERHITPRRDVLKARFDAACARIDARLAERLARDVFADTPPPGAARPDPAPASPARRGGLLGRLLGRDAAAPARGSPPAQGSSPTAAAAPRHQAALAAWQAELRDLPEGLDRACLDALIATVGGIVKKHGRLPADQALIAKLARVRACNRHGSRVVGDLIDPLIRAAAEAGEFTLLPAQDKPVVLNVKGASASGKSTLRNYQRELAERLGTPWQEFALVSPDYWRKHLLDYGSLGDDYKYAAVLTGEELEIIDRKLDEHFSRKAARGDMPHLLIDRFRFDSFVSSAKGEDQGNLLSRFGDRVFIFVMITPPAATVERAWSRGLSTGRYKAVDDLLYHNIEAYTGIPSLFFTWINKARQCVHFEFLDNGIPLGQRPRTVAYGWNGQLVVLDPAGLRKMDDYRHVNVDARTPDEVLLPPPRNGPDFLADCLRKVPEVLFLGPDGARVVARIKDGRCIWQQGDYLAGIGLPLDCPAGGAAADAPGIDVDHERFYTLGAWPADA